MNWFTRPAKPEQMQRATAEKLLSALLCYLPPDLVAYRSLLAQDHSLESVLNEIGSVLGKLIRQLQTSLDDLRTRSSILETSLKLMTEERDRLYHDPLRQRLNETLKEVQTLTGRAERAEAAMDRAQRALAAEQYARQQEVEKLQGYIASQNRIIAQQQLRLNTLLGDTSGAETTGGKTN